MKWSPTVEQGYGNLFSKMIVRDGHVSQISSIIAKILLGKERYVSIEKDTGVPWFWIGIVHSLEGNCNFSTYLGNGEPLSRRTTMVPVGRGPFKTWEDGASDAINLLGLSKLTDWSLPRCLYQFEAWNGFGYVKYNINSPYLWSFSSLYSCGKYVSDGEFDESAVSAQCGAAVILKEMIAKNIVSFTGKNMDELSSILTLAKVAAPHLADVLGGPASSIVIKMLAEELKTDSTASAVSQATQTQPAAVILAALSKVQDILLAASQASQSTPPSKANASQAPAPSAGILVDVNASVAHNLVSLICVAVFSSFIKDAALAHNLSDVAISILTFSGAVISQWFNRAALVASNNATLAAIR
jgi:lysozyme family protein